MNADESFPEPDPTPKPRVRSYLNNPWRVLWRALLCFFAGVMVSGGCTGLRGSAGFYRLGSSPRVGVLRTAERLADEGNGKDKTNDFVHTAAGREYVKEAFARQLQGMTWTWDGELNPGQP